MSNEDDVVIAVMGCTGSGKSSFVKLLSDDEGIKIGTSLESETSEVKPVRFTDRVSGRSITIVDTPGFDDSRPDLSDTKILERISAFLAQEYHDSRKINGLVYLQSVAQTRFSGQSRRNLKMFREICGTEAYENVAILTTFWDKAELEGEEREKELKSRYFKPLVNGGAHFMRLNHSSSESAYQVLSHILTLVPRNVQIQEEICVEGKSLEDTAAGSIRREELERIISQHKEEVNELINEINALKGEGQRMRKELEQERIELKERLARWEKEKLELKTGLDHERIYREAQERKAAKEREATEKRHREQLQELRDWLESGRKFNLADYPHLLEYLKSAEHSVLPEMISKPLYGAFGIFLDLVGYD